MVGVDFDVEELAASLEEARATTWRLVEDLSDEDARRAVSPELSPLSWHFGHVAWQEEVWALREVGGQQPILSDLDGIYDSFSSHKASRGARLPELPSIAGYAALVRERTLEILSSADGLDHPLLRGGWVFRFLANHERQHAETMAVVRLVGGLPLSGLPALRACVPRDAPFIEIDAGTFTLGDDVDPDGWDNERGAHEISLGAFEIGAQPVSSKAWLEFMEAGGYRDLRLWSPAGAVWLSQAQVEAPLHWRLEEEGWMRWTLAGWRPVVPSHPVSHISWYEAEAYARYMSARLPAEAEWERAAGDGVLSGSRGGKRRWPWRGEASGTTANLGLKNGDTTPCSSPGFGGNVWEWTASSFHPYPGFTPGPYRGYSEPWFGEEHRVLRGGCYLTHPANARTTFRNWFHPGMRAFPTGMRLARDR